MPGVDASDYIPSGHEQLVKILFKDWCRLMVIVKDNNISIMQLGHVSQVLIHTAIF